jgi:hypothetical protein
MTDQPTGIWQLNLQTLVLLGGIAGVLIAWGYTLSGLQRDTDRNSAGVAALTIGLEQNDSQTQQLEIRVVALEKIASDAITLRRNLEQTLGQFKADIEVIKSTLARIEKDRKPSP